MKSSILIDYTISIGDVLSLFSVVIAVSVYLHQNSLRRKLSRLQHTYDTVGLIFRDGPVAKARLELALWIAKNKQIENDVFEKSVEDETIITILDYYEYLCEGALIGQFDVDYINREHGYRIERTYYLLKHYISARENRLRNFTKEYGHDEKYVLNSSIKTFLRKHREKDDDFLEP